MNTASIITIAMGFLLTGTLLHHNHACAMDNQRRVRTVRPPKSPTDELRDGLLTYNKTLVINALRRGATVCSEVDFKGNPCILLNLFLFNQCSFDKTAKETEYLEILDALFQKGALTYQTPILYKGGPNITYPLAPLANMLYHNPWHILHQVHEPQQYRYQVPAVKIMGTMIRHGARLYHVLNDDYPHDSVMLFFTALALQKRKIEEPFYEDGLLIKFFDQLRKQYPDEDPDLPHIIASTRWFASTSYDEDVGALDFEKHVNGQSMLMAAHAAGMGEHDMQYLNSFTMRKISLSQHRDGVALLLFGCIPIPDPPRVLVAGYLSPSLESLVNQLMVPTSTTHHAPRS